MGHCVDVLFYFCMWNVRGLRCGFSDGSLYVFNLLACIVLGRGVFSLSAILKCTSDSCSSSLKGPLKLCCSFFVCFRSATVVGGLKIHTLSAVRNLRTPRYPGRRGGGVSHGGPGEPP